MSGPYKYLLRTYGFDEDHKQVYESDDPDIATSLWAEPKDPDIFKDSLPSAGIAYTQNMDVAPVVERYRACATFQGKPFDAAAAKRQLTVVAQDVLEAIELGVFSPQNEDYRQRQIALNAVGVSFEQLSFLANKAVSAYTTAVHDHRQMMAFLFPESYVGIDKERALCRDAILTNNEARAMLRLIMLRDSQVHGYFQERFEDHKQHFVLRMKHLMMIDIDNAVEAQFMIFRMFQKGEDEVEAAKERTMDDLVGSMDDLVDRMEDDPNNESDDEFDD